MLFPMNEIQELATIRANIDQLAELTGTSRSGLSVKAGLDPTTVNKIYRDDRVDMPSKRTLDKLAKAAGYDSYESFILKRGFSDNSPIPFEHEPLYNKSHTQVEKRGEQWLLNGVSVSGSNVHVLEMPDDSLKAAGYLPGDLIFYSIAATAPKPKEGDPVVAQHYMNGSAKTIVRILRGGYLMAADATTPPLPINDETVSIMARVIGSHRLI